MTAPPSLDGRRRDPEGSRPDGGLPPRELGLHGQQYEVVALAGRHAGPALHVKPGSVDAHAFVLLLAPAVDRAEAQLAAQILAQLGRLDDEVAAAQALGDATGGRVQFALAVGDHDAT